MAQVYIIAAEYGMWEDYTVVDLFATQDEAEAWKRLESIGDQFAGVYSQMVENYAYNGHFGDIEGEKAIVDTARMCWWDEGLTLTLRTMQLDSVNHGFEYMERRDIPFMPQDFVSLNDVEPHHYDSKYEQMAFPYEQEFYGVRH